MIEPVNNNVILEIATKLDKYAEDVKKRSGIIVSPKIAQGQPNQGVVLAIAKGIKDPEYSVGDIVVFSKGGIFEGFKHDGKDLVSVAHDEIVAKILEGSSDESQKDS